MAVTLGHALDPLRLERTGEAAGLEASELTRHAVCIGMTGSGKTGLCVGLLESLARAGVPILAVDPKGDLTNLALQLDPRRPEEFAPWVDAAEAARRGVDVATLAGRVAERHARALADEGVDSEALDAYRASVEVIVHTPGSEAGVPVDVLTALTRAPASLRDDPEGLRDYVTGAVMALLGLIGLEVDPLTDPRAILLARLFGDAFADGRDLPLERLLLRVVEPPFETLGYFPVDEVLPLEARRELALRLNNVAASPAFRPWLVGVPLDVSAWLAPTASGRTPVRVITLAHLDDRQRQFFLSLLLHAVVAWTRRLPGTGALRALVYVDEAVGLLPPHPRDPPTKAPILTLMKQARAVGVGVMLATQNPVDLDYKAVANAGTWFVGRLQTRQDRQRVVDGLVAASSDVDSNAVSELLGRLPRRTFAWRTAEQPSARVLRTRHVWCYLRGPLTRREIARLGQVWRSVDAPAGRIGRPPQLGPDVPVRWLRPEGVEALGLQPSDTWAPSVYARFEVRLDAHGMNREVHRWLRADTAEPVELLDRWLVHREPRPGVYAPVPPALLSPDLRRAWADALAETVFAVAPDGTPIRPGPAGVRLVGWAVVWVPSP